VARMGAENRVDLGGVALYGWHNPLIGSLLHPADSDPGDMMMLSLYVALGNLPAYRSAESIGTSQSDRLRSMVKLRPCRGNVDTGARNRQPAGRISGWVGRACCHRCSPDRAGWRNQLCGYLQPLCSLAVWENADPGIPMLAEEQTRRSGDNECRLQRLQEVLDELMALTDWNKL